MKGLKRILMKFPNLIYNFLVISFRNVSYEKYPQIIGRLIIGGRGKLSFGKQTKINSSISINPVGLSSKTMFYLGNEGLINIGNNVGISNSLLYAKEKIEIKDNVLIGGGCQLLDNDFHQLYSKDRIANTGLTKSAPIIINEAAFIGTSSIIMKGVTIGARSIVAAGSVVTKSIPPDEIWGGNPAVFIKKHKAELQLHKELN